MANTDEKSRLLGILAGQTQDRPACIIPGGMMNMTTAELAQASGVQFPAAHTNASSMATLARAAHDLTGIENYGVPFCMTVEAEALGATVDFGSDLCEPHVVAGSVLSLADKPKLSPINLEGGRVKTVLEAIGLLKAESAHTGVPVVGNVVGPVSVAGTVMDMELLLREMYKHRASCHEFVAFITEQVSRYAQAMVEAGADVICIAEPSGTGEILGPKLFKEFTVHYLNQLVDTLGNTPTIVHICGHLDRVLPQLAELHGNGFSFDATTTVATIRKAVPQKVLIGNVSTFALKDATQHKVSTLTEFALRQGVEIVAPACGISMSTPTENIRAMSSCVRGVGEAQPGAAAR